MTNPDARDRVRSPEGRLSKVSPVQSVKCESRSHSLTFGFVVFTKKKRERGLDEVRGVVGERPFVALDRLGGTERPMRTSRRRWIRGAKHRANGDEPHVERLVFTVLNPKT